MKKRKTIVWSLLIICILLITSIGLAAVGSEIVGTVRVQVLSPTLVRLENRGPNGFEDRATLFISNRTWPGATYSRSTAGGYDLIQTTDFIVKVPSSASSLSGIIITKTDSTQIWAYSSLPGNRAWLPAITDNTLAWAIADTPRMVPASWGYNPAAQGVQNYSTNGWDLTNDAPDMYVFLPKGNVRQLRTDFLDLTGHTELIPLYALGYWDSRWYEYTEQSALQQIDDYRNHDIPIDVLVIDTDWRVNGSTGYDINTTDFPDMTRFMTSAHAKNARIMFNDHPEPIATGLDPTEVTFRNNGLRGLNQKGLDIWWYDRNWSVALTPPAGIAKEAWGMYLYNWVAGDYYSTRRPIIMANVDGIDNGSRNNAPTYITHRYTLQWTGDISPDFASLQREVDNAVHGGMYAAFPYMSADLGGHTSNPSNEAYVRWLQYGTLSPICRPHCTKNLTRMPWTFGTTAEDITRKFIKMRYRLLPLFYTLARKSYDTGEPILRRCDFDYPSNPEAASNTQYLLGDSTLVAPVLQAISNYSVVPSGWLKTTGGATGLAAEYFNNNNLTGSPVLTRTDTTVDFNWGTGGPGGSVPTDNFSTRWTGNITIGSEDAVLALTTDDGARLYVDNTLLIDAWKAQDSVTNETTVTFTHNTTHSIRIEYSELTGNAVCSFKWRPASSGTYAKRTLWIPAGSWIDAWTGNVITGPQTITVDVPLEKMPMYIKPGTMVPLAPDMLYTAQRAWDPIILDVYPTTSKTASASLYEDDTVSKSYKTGAYRTTQMSATVDSPNKKVTVTVNPAQGTYTGALTNRAWVVRVHKPLEWSNPTPSSATVDGAAATYSVKTKDATAMPFANTGGSPDSDVIEVTVPSGSVSNTRTIVVNYSVIGATATPTPTPTPTPTATPSPTPAATTTVTFQQGVSSYTGSADTHIMEYFADRNAGGNDRFEVSRYTGTYTNDDKAALLKFDLSSIPSNATITSATVELTLVECRNGTAAKSIEVHKLNRAWGEGTKTGVDGVTATSGESSWTCSAYSTQWTTAGGDYNSTAVDTKSIGSTIGTVYSWNVTSLVQGWVSSSSTNYGMAFMEAVPQSTSNGTKDFASKEYATASSRPKLTVTYTTGASGVLNVSYAANPASVNLTSEGTIDWANWGCNSATDFNHKSGVTQQISNYTLLGGGVAGQAIDCWTKFSWTDGTPTASKTDNINMMFVSDAGKGWQITIPAGTTQRTLRVYTSAWKSKAKFEVSLSDGSAVAYSDYIDNSGASTYKTYTIVFKAASNGQTLTVKNTAESIYTGGGNLTLQSATLF
jgi:alpha-glucosidase (family GH31 glycosyl hydrolase)